MEIMHNTMVYLDKQAKKQYSVIICFYIVPKYSLLAYTGR